MLKTVPESVQGQPPRQGSRAPPATSAPWAGTAPNGPGRGRRPFRGPTVPQQRRPTLLEMVSPQSVGAEWCTLSTVGAAGYGKPVLGHSSIFEELC